MLDAQPCLNHGQSPWKATVPLPQCRQPAESWGPAQQRGGGIIPLFLLPLFPSSNFTGSCDLWPNPAREGTQLPWASPLGCCRRSRLAQSRADCTRVQLVAGPSVPSHSLFAGMTQQGSAHAPPQPLSTLLYTSFLCRHLEGFYLPSPVLLSWLHQKG